MPCPRVGPETAGCLLLESDWMSTVTHPGAGKLANSLASVSVTLIICPDHETHRRFLVIKDVISIEGDNSNTYKIMIL